MLTPHEQMKRLRDYWSAQAARQDKPSPAWIVVDTDRGEVIAWSLARRTAQRIAREHVDGICHIARLDPRDY